MKRRNLCIVGAGMLLPAGCGPAPEQHALESGVIVEIVEAGDGAALAPERYFAASFVGRLAATEEVVLQAVDPPMVTRLDATAPLLPGLIEGLEKLKTGDRALIHVPARLAYGSHGKNRVPPLADLSFTVEVLEQFQQTDSGLQYRILKPGEGTPPKEGDHVVFDYEMKFTDSGRVIHSSKKLGRTEEYILGRGTALPGLEELLTQMRPGARWECFLPPELGYGEKGRQPVVPPGSELQLIVHLKGVR